MSDNMWGNHTGSGMVSHRKKRLLWKHTIIVITATVFW
jgi:hypothetical protein